VCFLSVCIVQVLLSIVDDEIQCAQTSVWHSLENAGSPCPDLHEFSSTAVGK